MGARGIPLPSGKGTTPESPCRRRLGGGLVTNEGVNPGASRGPVVRTGDRDAPRGLMRGRPVVVSAPGALAVTYWGRIGSGRSIGMKM